MKGMRIREVNEKGFTLAETLLVLGVISIILLIVSKSIFSVSDTMLTKQFIEQLKTDLSYAQSRALSTGEVVWITFDVREDTYYINSSNFFLERKLPIYATFTFSNFNNLWFNKLGNTSQSGTITFQIFDENYKLVILLGMGRFYVEK